MLRPGDTENYIIFCYDNFGRAIVYFNEFFDKFTSYFKKM